MMVRFDDRQIRIEDLMGRLFVIARNSSVTYKGKAVDMKRVERELGVRYVLEGSVRKAGSRSVVHGGGAIAVDKGSPGTTGPSTHAYGGTRIGDNRDTNVVDRWGFSHEVPNLGVLGASVMGTSGAHNPILTAQALA